MAVKKLGYRGSQRASRGASALLLPLALPAPAFAEWWEARTDNFIVLSKSSAKDAQIFAERLERFDQAMRSLQNIKPGRAASDWTRVKVYRTGNIAYMGRLAGGTRGRRLLYSPPRRSGGLHPSKA